MASRAFYLLAHLPLCARLIDQKAGSLDALLALLNDTQGVTVLGVELEKSVYFLLYPALLSSAPINQSRYIILLSPYISPPR